MKIAFVFPPMWSPHSDGSLQIWNREVTVRLAKSSDVLVYSGRFSFQRNDCVDGVHYRRFSTKWNDRLIKLLRHLRELLGVRDPLFASDLWYIGYYLKVALDLRRQGCDVAHVHYYPQFAALIKSFNPSVRVILHMHGEWLTQVKFTNLESRLDRLDLIISCSEFVTKAICARFPAIADRCKTVPMGLAPEDYSFGRCSVRSLSSKRLLCVGRISPEKGVHVLLEAFERILQQYPDATLTIVGPEWISPREDIADRCLTKEVIASVEPFYSLGYLSQLKEKLNPNSAERVTFTGLVAHRDVPAFYERADVYVCPSLYESFGASVLEAMAACLPVVATRVGAVPELISHKRNGLIVETNNPSSIAESVIKLFRDPELRSAMGLAARETVCRKYSWETICYSLTQMYECH